MALKELITNNDGRLSTTAFIQFFGALLMACFLDSWAPLTRL